MLDFTFEESCIINDNLKTVNQELFVFKLDHLIKNTEDTDLVEILITLKEKISSLDKREIKKLFDMIPLNEFSFID